MSKAGKQTFANDKVRDAAIRLAQSLNDPRGHVEAMVVSTQVLMGRGAYHASRRIRGCWTPRAASACPRVRRSSWWGGVSLRRTPTKAISFPRELR